MGVSADLVAKGARPWGAGAAVGMTLGITAAGGIESAALELAVAEEWPPRQFAALLEETRHHCHWRHRGGGTLQALRNRPQLPARARNPDLQARLVRCLPTTHIEAGPQADAAFHQPLLQPPAAGALSSGPAAPGRWWA